MVQIKSGYGNKVNTKTTLELIASATMLKVINSSKSTKRQSITPRQKEMRRLREIFGKSSKLR